MARSRVYRTQIKTAGTLREAKFSKVDEDALEYRVPKVRAKRQKLPNVLYKDDYITSQSGKRIVKDKKKDYPRDRATIRRIGFETALAEEVILAEEI